MAYGDAGLTLAAYAAFMTLTPGPNNLLLMASGLTFGVAPTVRHLSGILCGVLLQICVTGAGLGAIFSQWPLLQGGLKLAGTLYMLWLAQRLWLASERTEMSAVRPIGFAEAMLFQFVNPKTWVMATTVIAAFVPVGEGYPLRVVTAGLIFTLVALPCILVWVIGGAWLRMAVDDPRARRQINGVMAVLAACTPVLFWL